MKATAFSAELAYAEAVEQLQMRAVKRDRWSSRAVFWTAVRFGVDQVLAVAWPEARSRWEWLWSVAVREHLPPIPGIPEAENMPSDATAAELEFARMRAIVGGKGKR
ncbi:hypothetical protein CF70_017900 [Cupriavidus sp. SK-3]|uniref:hypothetical protein n=1 Tax=Cupriavidus sp. SK-3 TaxID=1470558 RepID=UPI00044F08D3|nr:hypothetical protein [Cupriavidus sp. SK-3]KDP84691.1 hypothetical protein CF70_017900 [Cupriavidus sp. SK-3]